MPALLIVTWVVSAMYCFNIIAWPAPSSPRASARGRVGASDPPPSLSRQARPLLHPQAGQGDCLPLPDGGPGHVCRPRRGGPDQAQQMIVGSQEKKKAAQKLKELNLRTQDIIAIMISGLVLLLMFAAFILLGTPHPLPPRPGALPLLPPPRSPPSFPHRVSASGEPPPDGLAGAHHRLPPLHLLPRLARLHRARPRHARRGRAECAKGILKGAEPGGRRCQES